MATFWATFGNLWATLCSDIWSHWLNTSVLSSPNTLVRFNFVSLQVVIYQAFAVKIQVVDENIQVAVVRKLVLVENIHVAVV